MTWNTISLFSTFITAAEVLTWTITGDLSAAMIDEAYGQWFEQDREQAEFYRDCWKGFVHVKPSGGYDVWIEAEVQVVPSHKIDIPVDVVQRCRNLIAELGRIGRKASALGVAEMPILVSLDERSAVIWEELADELIDLLIGNDLASLGKEKNGE